MGESIFYYFDTQNCEQKISLYKKAYTSKLLLFHGRKKLEDSIDSENWMIRNDVSKLKLNILLSCFQTQRGSIAKITVDKMSRARFTQEEIRFCPKVFSTFQHLKTVSLTRNFWKSLVFYPLPIDELQFDQRAVYELFSGSCKSLSQIKLQYIFSVTFLPEPWKQQVLKPIT